MSWLAASGLVKAYGDQPVLRGLDLTVPRGSLTAVVGPSGCGKTTLLRLIAGFDHLDAGRIVVAGRVVSGDGVHLPPEQRRIGYVPQEGALFPHLRVVANVGFGVPRSERRTGRVGELLELVGLGGLGDRWPHELSGGQQQRVALARALAPNPSLVLLDEPFASLDAGLRASVRADVKAALAAAGATAVLVTHDQTEAFSLADRVAVLRDGRIVQAADPATLYWRPADPGVARFTGEAVLLPARVDADVATCALGRLPVRGGPLGGEATVMIRPEQIVCDGIDRGAVARVRGVTFYGHDAMVHLTLADGALPTELVARVLGNALPAPGAVVGVRVVGEVVAFPSPAEVATIR